MDYLLYLKVYSMGYLFNFDSSMYDLNNFYIKIYEE